MKRRRCNRFPQAGSNGTQGNCRGRSPSARAGEQGIALLMVLWIMVFLTVIVTEFAYSMRTELSVTRNFKDDVQSYYLARAGIERALAELSTDYDYNYLDENGDVVFGKKEIVASKETGITQEEEPVLSPGAEAPLGEGTFSFRVIDLEGRIDINIAMTNRTILNELLIQAGVKEKMDRDTIIDSMLDWKDADDLHRLNGAEDSYYLGLDPPYPTKDGRLETVEELLNIKGITEQILYGDPGEENGEEPYKGLINFLNVTGTKRVNINTAPEEVLRALGYDESRLEVLHSDRDRYSIPPRLNRFPRGTFVPTIKSNNFSIEGRGDVNGGKRTIKIDVQVGRKGSGKVIKIKRWDDNHIRNM